MKKIRTDREILRAIYERYYNDFMSFEQGNKTRDSSIYLPIDIPAVARVIDMEPELVFGRLYYHLAPKYGRVEAKVRVPFFEKNFPNQVTGKPDLHVVNFPVLESALANLEYEERKFKLPIVISSVSLGIAIIAVGVNIFSGSTARAPTSTAALTTSAIPASPSPTPVAPTKQTGP